MTDLVISEIFGPTVQGEGPTSGQPCAFVRTSNCNLDCKWCDTPYTWDWTRYNKTLEQKTVTIQDVHTQLSTMPVRRVVISGGEPLLQQQAVTQLAQMLHTDGWAIEIETNGTIPPQGPLQSLAQFNVSIKLPHAKTTANPVRPVAIKTFAQMAHDDMPVYFKWVAANPSDIKLIKELSAKHDLPKKNTWVMPLGTNTRDVAATTELLADHIVHAGFHASTRMHVFMWGDKRGH